METVANSYTALRPEELAREFDAMARDVPVTFGRLNWRQLNWRPAPASWSVAQCFDHLVKSEAAMSSEIARALDRALPLTLWQRLPLWPRLFGWMLVASQAPGGKRKFKAPEAAVPSASDVAPGVLDRFVARQQDLATTVRALDEDRGRRIMVSPFAAQITYSVLDGYRIIAAHQRRHFAQAQGVMQAAGFPA